MNMKVFRVVADVERRYILPARASDWTDLDIEFDCSRKSPDWRPLDVYSPEPDLPDANFMYFSPGVLAVTAPALERVRKFLEYAGELLPLVGDQEGLCLFNSTVCVNCLDADKCGWFIGSEGERLILERYAFVPERFFKHSVFKIPETKRAELLVLERNGDPASEFKAAVETFGLTGIAFEELWSG